MIDPEMTAVALALLGTLAALLALHPFVFYPLSLALLNRHLATEPDDGWPSTVTLPDQPVPRFSVCLCAYNEERVIEQKVRNLLALRERTPGGLDILIYVDAGSDRTAELLAPYADRLFVHVARERHGKTHGMNLLVRASRTPLLVFTDANVMLDPHVLERLEAYFRDASIGCVCGRIVVDNPGESGASASSSLFTRLDDTIRLLEGRSGTVMGAHGGLFAIRRALHRPPPDHIIDDLYVSMMILCNGHRIVQADDVTGHEFAASSQADEFRRKVRIACQSFNVHRMIWPRIRTLSPMIVYQYLSHKLLRWLSIYFLAAAALAYGAALVVAGQWMLAALLLDLLMAGLMLGRYGIGPLLPRVFGICASLAGTGLGVWRSLRGERFQTWTPAASVRRSS